MNTTYTTLMSVAELAASLASSTPAVLLDCSFDLGQVEAGRQQFLAGHLPGARYVHLDEALSSAKTGRNGRHPLPSREQFVQTMATLGVNDTDQVVVYDNSGGMYAARLWWMLRWVGHGAVALLDGGPAAWQQAGGSMAQGLAAAHSAGQFSLRQSLVGTVDYATVLANLNHGQRLVIDARAPDRFRGENETLDPIGGHIPGARNRLFRDNLGADGRFKPAAQLRAEFDAISGGLPGSDLIAQCGSGVTACHNMLALEIAGLSGACLYPGSWSEWCTQDGAPIATGAQ